MARYIQHIVDPSHDPEIAVLVTIGRIARHIVLSSKLFRKIGFLEALRVTPQRARERREGALDDKKPAFAIRYVVPRFIHDCRLDSGQRQSAGTRFERYRTRCGCDHMAAGFGLPPGIDDRTARLDRK